MKILLVDDDETIRFGMARYLTKKGHAISEAGTQAEARALLGREVPELCVIDHHLPDGDCLSTLQAIQAQVPGCPVIVLTGHASIDLAVNAIKQGAQQFLTKPVELDVLHSIIERTMTSVAHRRDAQAVRAQSRGAPNPFLGTSQVMRELEQFAARVAPTNAHVLITGETGVGKSVLAAWLHAQSPRAAHAFVDLNAAGVPRELFESELFGHEKGAFTGATSAKEGFVELAHSGTLFLDEIGDVEADIQPKLLKVLEERRFRRLGDTRERTTDIRILAATNQDLQAQIDNKRFRADLYYRLSTVILHLPPLRERREDIVPLAEDLLVRLGRNKRAGMRLSDGARAQLEQYDWPGNIRELRNVIERAVIFCDGDEIDARALRFDRGFKPTVSAGEDTAPVVLPASSGADAPPAATAVAPGAGAFVVTETVKLEEVEARYIRHVLQQHDGHVEQASRALQMSRSTLYYKMRTHGIKGAAAAGDE